MRSIRIEIRQTLDAALVQARALKDGNPPLPELYRIDVAALDEKDNPIGGVQRLEGRTLIELIEKLSMAYGHLYQHLKILTADNKRLRAQFTSLRR